MLRYCLFLRSAPHHSEAKISHCTVSVLLMICAGATRLHVKPNCVCVNKQSNRRARIEIWEGTVRWRLRLTRPTKRNAGRVRRSRHPAGRGEVIGDADAGSSAQPQSQTGRSGSTEASYRYGHMASGRLLA
ncbi:hypothetical protein EKN38_04830 [Enterobacter sp. WCHEn045836]|nr:hypothetical protein EKN38_04830 [Enterobacter sp. WCHEn045836]